MRASLIVLAVMLAAGPALAQTSAGPGTEVAPPPAAPHFNRRQWQEAFDAANTAHDGHLTLVQAQAGMPGIARNFDAIDAAHHGYVTKDEIRAYYAARAHAATAK